MKQWQDFAAKQSDRVVDANFICAADELGVILVNGEDARDFLQNQLSNDIDAIDETRSQLSSYSTPKGRMLGIVRVVRITNGYLLVTHGSMVAPLLERLYRYILQSRVTLADAGAYFARFALQSDLPAVTGHPLLPAEADGVVQNDSIVALRFAPLGEQQRFLLLCLSADEAIALWQDFAARLEVAGYAAWHLAEIRSAVPMIYPETAEEFVLQMANLDALGGVSFKKGCYPGQEIVARTHYLGKLKRRMFLAELETGEPPRPGDELVLDNASEADGSGMVVDAAVDGGGRCLCLYVARIDRAETGSLRLLKQPEARLRNVELPYPL